MAWLHLLPVFAGLVVLQPVSSCDAKRLSLTILGEQATINAPAVREGSTVHVTCAEALPGLVGRLQLRCLGSVLTLDVAGCSAAICAIGDGVEVQLSSGAVAAAKLTEPLEHGRIGRIACKQLAKGLESFVEVHCKFGKLVGDSSRCRAKLQGESTAWRLTNGVHLPSTWRVFEVELFTDAACEGDALTGVAISSSDSLRDGLVKSRAFDKNIETAWAAGCQRGCAPGTAWIGLSLPQPSALVRCIWVLQSKVSCCSSSNVSLEVWTGKAWQGMYSWSTDGLTRFKKGFQLKVPITCTQYKPEGDALVHNCDGPPVRGLQNGESCQASCKEGFYGGTETFTCGESGAFAGLQPQCFEISVVLQFAQLAGGLAFFLSWACQYRFWCMRKKPRLIDDDLDKMIPEVMRGHWLEKHGAGGSVWDMMLKDKRKEMQFEITMGDEEEGHQNDSVEEMAHAGLASADGVGFGDLLHKVKDKQEEKKKKEKKDKEEGGHDGKDDGEDDGKDKEGKDDDDNNGKEKKKISTSLDGLCSPCENPDLCWSFCMCPCCRMADTWHTLGIHPRLNYWRAFVVFLVLPCCCPCLSFYGRYRVRRTFEIELEPHRDCCIYCCCCCCCAPCALCQEARLVDAPVLLHVVHKRQQQLAERQHH